MVDILTSKIDGKVYTGLRGDKIMAVDERRQRVQGVSGSNLAIVRLRLWRVAYWSFQATTEQEWVHDEPGVVIENVESVDRIICYNGYMKNIGTVPYNYYPYNSWGNSTGFIDRSADLWRSNLDYAIVYPRLSTTEGNWDYKAYANAESEWVRFEDVYAEPPLPIIVGDTRITTTTTKLFGPFKTEQEAADALPA